MHAACDSTPLASPSDLNCPHNCCHLMSFLPVQQDANFECAKGLLQSWDSQVTHAHMHH
jgi:hypothetical protein